MSKEEKQDKIRKEAEECGIKSQGQRKFFKEEANPKDSTAIEKSHAVQFIQPLWK